jgi:hypothetical protein
MHQGVVRDDELGILLPDAVAAFFLRAQTLEADRCKMRKRKSFPYGEFPCYKYRVAGTKSILALFERATAVDLVFRKYFATPTGFDSHLEPLNAPLAASEREDYQLGYQPRSTHYIHWLACDSDATWHHSLQIAWWPSLFPESKFGKLVFKFNYVHEKDSLRLRANLPIAPVVCRDQDAVECLRWRAIPLSRQEDEQVPLAHPKLKIRLAKLA